MTEDVTNVAKGIGDFGMMAITAAFLLGRAVYSDCRSAERQRVRNGSGPGGGNERCTGPYSQRQRVPVALQANGFIAGRGGFSCLTINRPGESGEGSTAGRIALPYDKLAYQNEFVFQISNTNGQEVLLPSVSQLQSAFGELTTAYDAAVADHGIYHMTLINIRWSNGKVYVRGVEGAPLILPGNMNPVAVTGAAYGQYILDKSEAATFTYFNRSWYVTGSSPS